MYVRFSHTQQRKKVNIYTLQEVLKSNPKTSKTELENELNIYI